MPRTVSAMRERERGRRRETEGERETWEKKEEEEGGGGRRRRKKEGGRRRLPHVVFSYFAAVLYFVWYKADAPLDSPLCFTPVFHMPLPVPCVYT